MKKILGLIITVFILQGSVLAQDFVLNNPVMTPNPGQYPNGTETVSFDFYVAQSSFTFSNDALSNNYATITFSFTKLNPTSTAPGGTGAALFNWVLTNNGGSGTGLVYTWTGTTKSVTMNVSPSAAKYKITFTNTPITSAATQAQSDVRLAGQFTDPGNAPTGASGNNSAVIATYTSPSGGPLPIHLLSFTGAKAGNKVQLNWQTSSEQNSKNFEVEFSENASQWNSIGTVKAAGTSSVQSNYSLIHNTPVNGINYYRLKQVDLDNNFTYSNVVAINFSISGLNISSVYPNPFVNQIKIDFSSDRSEVVTIHVNDNMGRIVKVMNASVQKGINSISLDNLSSLPSGIYDVEVKTSYSVFRYKLKK